MASRRRRMAPAEEAADVPPDWKPRARTREQLVEIVERLPTEPGVYVMRDRKGRVVYVGKARRLRQRVRQYFNGHDTRLFVPALGRVLGDIEAVITSNDKEAMLLENNLIKRYHPRFNVKLRDDKQYLVLRLDTRASWPRLEVVRNIGQDGASYYGPYHSATSARHTLRVVNRHFQLRTCTDFVLEHRKRPCLQYQIQRCPAPCVYEVDERAYADQVRDVGLFLAGRHGELVEGLRGRMETAAEALEFERAARIRDQLRAIEVSLQRQQVVGVEELDQDVIGVHREGGNVEFVVMHVRQGKLIGSQRYAESGMELPDEEVLASFLGAYYDESPLIPDEVLLPFELAEDDGEPLAAWLSERRAEQGAKKVQIKVPKRGSRKTLCMLAERNAASNFATRRSKRDDAEAAMKRLQARLSLSRLPRRIECYDVSHIQGSDPVASMVVFVDGQPDKASYRRFKIKGLDRDEGLSQGGRQNDDFLSMYEVLDRRLRRGLEDEDWALPDLLVIDGGKGQLARVVAAMQDLGVGIGDEGVDLVSLAKERRFAVSATTQGLEALRAASEGEASSGELGEGEGAEGETPSVEGEGEGEEKGEGERAREAGRRLADHVVATADHSQDGGEVRPERVFVPGARDPIVLARGSSELHLITRLRDEAHRFAIEHHRKRRGKRSLASVLDGISGVGPATKRALIQHFGTIKAIRAASEAELCAVKGVGPKLAAAIHEQLAAGG
ncbi:excinuclease ABC subunit UvrC [Pseudenhygromyxa sp. WMMC2535]|uniref:excinuclease ABC subunit UvrC n=1 Tax=Pseudenhygromyxa sp. WMMC2535 TaxID=2712867 RepID=UPI00155251CC|nr:excinuclease ABC subunit UvrC [Pseudenhygromyxa sp. WMMC2535]NVB37291.1 excinuclease ABC subunit UvrC [Pseudenhygromyxa sp. WMMC2535]